VQHTPDPYHLDYVIVHLGRGTAPIGSAWNSDLLERFAKIRQVALARRMLAIQAKVSKLQMQIQAHLTVPGDPWRQEEEAYLRRLLAKSEPEELTKRLYMDDALHRLVAVQMIGERRLHLENDLIDMLSDPEPAVRQAAQRSLVRLARGTDFGPRPDAGKLQRVMAIEKWRAWVALQAPADAATVVPSPTGQEAEAIQLCVQFLQAIPKEQDKLLAGWKNKAGEVAILAMAGTVAELKPERQVKVRQTLADRLASLDDKKLAAYLADEDSELRRAAAKAVGMKKAEALIPDLLRTLEDAHSDVAQAARTGLKQLTGQDFGPQPDAGALERFAAIGQWYRWWQERQEKIAGGK